MDPILNKLVKSNYPKSNNTNISPILPLNQLTSQSREGGRKERGERTEKISSGFDITTLRRSGSGWGGTEGCLPFFEEEDEIERCRKSSSGFSSSSVNFLKVNSI